MNILTNKLALLFLLFTTISCLELQAQSYPCASPSPLPYPETNVCFQNFLALRPDCCDIDFDVTCYFDAPSLNGFFQECEDGSQFTWDNCYDHNLYIGINLTGTSNPCGGNQPSLPPLAVSCIVFDCCEPGNSCAGCDSDCNFPPPPNDGGCPATPYVPYNDYPAYSGYDGCLVETILFDGACCTVDWDVCCQLVYNDISNGTPDLGAYAACGYTNDPTKARYPCDDRDPSTIDACHNVIGCINIPNVSIPSVPQTTAKLWLQGPNLGSTMASNSFIPNAQPFNTSPWNYTGTENVTPPSNAVDWILFEARNTTDPSIIEDRAAGFLLNDGTVQDVDGTAGVIKFPNNILVVTGSYYLAVRTRNHLDVMSATPVPMFGGLYDFTTDATQAFETFNSADQQMLVEANGTGTGAPYALFSGDINGDGIINFADFDEYTLNNGATGYKNADLDMGGTVNPVDFNDHFQPNNMRMSIQVLRH